MEQKDQSGALFRNDKKGNDKAPDYKGKAVVNGTSVKISAWVNTPKSGGEKYLSLKFEDDVPKADAQVQSAQDETNDLPF